MVLIFLGNIQFEAKKFETRTMPTPTMKGKEMIYWIRVETTEKRLVTELDNFLKGAPQHMDLKVPSTFIAANVELENYTPYVPDDRVEKSEDQREPLEHSGKEGNQLDAKVDRTYAIEIILRRTLPDQPAKHAQSPYG